MIPAMLDVPGARLHYRLDGPVGAPVVALASSLGTTLAMWDDESVALRRKLRVLRYDLRGHGASSISSVPIDIADLGRDVLALLDAIPAASVHFVGLSLGGMVGLWLGAHWPQRLRSLVLSNTAALIGTREAWDARIAAVASGGMAAIAEVVLERWFTRGFRERAPVHVERFRRMLLGIHPAGYVAACAAVRDADLRAIAVNVAVPTLVITGQHDVATPPAGGRWLADTIAGARYVELAAAHLANVEAGPAWCEHIVGFLAERETDHGRAGTT